MTGVLVAPGVDGRRRLTHEQKRRRGFGRMLRKKERMYLKRIEMIRASANKKGGKHVAATEGGTDGM